MSFYFQIPIIIFFLMLFMQLSYKHTLILTLSNLIFSNLSKFFHSLNFGYFYQSSFVVVMSTMFYILYFNFFSVFPYTFPLCSQPSYVMFFSFSIWFCIFSNQMINNFKGFLSHCIPEGSPVYLTFFLFVIELVSNFIRPLTLGVRLCANILAGHLLMVLLSQLVLKLFFLSPVYMALNLVEFFVSVIQSYIFVTLSVLYLSEVK